MSNFHVDHELHADVLADTERIAGKALEALQKRPLSSSDVAWAMHSFERLAEDLYKVFEASTKETARK